ncbi:MULTISPECIES: LysR family transcriptional regulator [Microbacterium]|jgi:DNA-binding transcriptional LysR family regulator|uniref:LysR family transcriptional regulator n=1 Tax=Microbacterium TaxID=33882 RepID=UPI0023DC4867|nr:MULTISPECIES: LysR family transcriptional regulator [Microbacterium]MDF2046460.1 LysR family transcriptional regulator [Microbacterium sp. Kw_RZR3]MDF2506773.1 hypothetical protein [Microbacterium sp.]MDQ1075873.1 DNA-binding transcriptional LysR family regulator [Microbacterium sp. SORGH_AS_0969]MDQ1116118.1 DNA-binding transcriptional LysR family regulator [Microbacterium testaceum]
MIDVHKLRQFLIVVKTGSFTRAAEALNLSQSALSRSIQSLEEHLGTRLIERERGRTGITLTLAGTELFERSDAILHDLDEMESRMTGMPVRAVPTISFGIGPMLGGVVLPGFFKDRLLSTPDLRVRVHTSTSDLMTELLLDGEIEFYLGLPSVRRRSTRVRQQVFGNFAPNFFVRPGHPLAEQERVTIEDLLAFPRISGTAWSENLMSLGSERDRYLFASSLQVDDYGMLVDIASSSDALIVASTQRPGDGLVRLPITIELAISSSELSVFSLAGTRMSPLAAEIVDDLKNRYLALYGAEPAFPPSSTSAHGNEPPAGRRASP